MKKVNLKNSKNSLISATCTTSGNFLSPDTSTSYSFHFADGQWPTASSERAERYDRRRRDHDQWCWWSTPPAIHSDLGLIWGPMWGHEEYRSSLSTWYWNYRMFRYVPEETEICIPAINPLWHTAKTRRNASVSPFSALWPRCIEFWPFWGDWPGSGGGVPWTPLFIPKNQSEQGGGGFWDPKWTAQPPL